MRRLARRAGRAALGIAALVLLGAGFLHTPPGRNLSRQLLLGLLRRGGLEARLAGVRVDPFRLEARVSGLELSAPDRAPFLLIEEGRIRLGPSTVLGRPIVRDLSLTGLRLALERGADGSWNLPAVASAPGTKPLDLRPFLGGEIAVRDAEVRVRDGISGIEVEATALRLDWSGRDGRGELRASEDARWRQVGSGGDAPPSEGALRQGRVALSGATLSRAGDGLEIVGPTLRTAEGSLTFGGTIDTLAEPTRLRAHAQGQAALVWAQLPVAISLSGHYAAGETRVEAEARRARGRAALTLLWPATGEAKVEAQWQGLDAATLLRAGFPGDTLAVEGRLSGGLAAGWPVAAEDVARTATVEAHAVVEADRSPAVGQDRERSSPSLAWRGRTRLDLRQGSYSLDLDHDFGGAASVRGRLAGKLAPARLAETSLAGPIAIVVERPAELLRAAGSPLAWPLTGRMTATLGLAGTVGAPRATGPVEVRALRAHEGPPLDADARVEWSDGRARFELTQLRGAGLRATGAVSLEGDGRITGGFEGSLASLAEWTSAFPPGFAPSGSLAARARITGTTARPEATVEIEGRDVSLLGQPAAKRLTGQLRASAIDGLELSSLVLEREQGRMEAAGSVSVDGRSLALRASLHDFAVAPVPASVSGGGLPLRARLDGPLALTLEGSAATGEGRIALRELSFDDRPLGEGTIVLSSTGDALEGELNLPTLGATLAARWESAAPHPLSAEIRLVEASIEAWARALGAASAEMTGKTSLHARLRGPGSDLALATGEVSVERFEGRLRQVPFRLRRPAHLFASRERFGTDGVDLEAAGFRAQLDGALAESGALALALVIEGDLRGLEPLFRTEENERKDPLALSGRAQIRARVTGTPTQPRPEATLDLDRGQATRGERVLARSVAAAAAFSGGTLRLHRLDGELGGLQVSLTGEAGAGLLRPSLPPPSSPWTRALRSALAGEARASLDLEARSVATEAAEETPLRIEAHFETDAAELHRIRGRAEIRGLRFDLQDVSLRQDQPFTALLENGRLTIPEVAWRGGETDLRLGGAVRLDPSAKSLAESALDLRANGVLDLRLLNALGRGFEAGGVARLAAEVKGTVARPEFLGSLRVADAVLSYQPWRLRLDDLSAALVADRGRLTMENLSGSLNGGSLSGGGTLALEGGRLEGGALELTLSGATVDWPKGFRGGLDGQLALRGTETGPVLAGTLALANASYRGDPRTLVSTHESLGAPADESASPLAGLGLDLHLRTEPDVRVDNPFGEFAFGVDVQVTGSAASPRLAGQVELQPRGFVYWSGRRFDIERGTLDWKAASGLMPFVQARATSRVSNYNVFADFSGPLETAEARLASDPPLSTNEITSLLVTGSTSAGAADSRALGIVSANLLGNFGRRAGLDSVRIDSGDDQSLLNFDPTKVVGETNPAQRLTVTKRLSANLEATVSLNLSESGKTTTFVSYKPWPAFEVRVAQRDDYTGSLEFRHDVSLGGGGGGTARSRAASKPPSSKPEVVGAVQIDDRAGADARALEVKLKLRPGAKFTYEAWQEDRDRIEAAVARRGHAEAYVVARRSPRAPAPEGGAVDLGYVVERGARTAVRVRDLELSTSFQRDLRRAWSRGDYDTSIEAEAEGRVRDELAREGYFLPRIRVEVVASAGGEEKTLLISGARGPHLRERRIAFEGAQVVPRERLQTLVDGKDLQSQAWNSPERLERAVVAECLREGLLAAKAKARPPVAEGGRAVLVVEVDEGPVFTRGRVSLTGCSAVPCSEVEAALGLPAGGTYRLEDNEAGRGRVVGLYRRGGWNAAQARLSGTIHTSTASVDLEVQVEEGPRQVLQELVVEGGARGTRRALDSLVRLEPGTPVVLQDWAALRRQVYGTGLVRGVSLEPETAGVSAPAADGVEPVVARLRYDEWPALRLRYGLQLVTEQPLSSTEGQAVDLGATAELSRATLLGRALSTGLSAEARASHWTVRGVLSAPRTLGRPLRSSLYLVREQEDFDVNLIPGRDPTAGRAGSWQLTLEERYRPARKLELALSYDIQWIDIDVPGAKELERPLALRPARVIPTVLMDGRNSILDPSRGYFSSLSYSLGAKALGSQFDFTRVFVQQFAYVPLPGGLVSASGFRYDRSGGDRGQAFLSTERLAFGGPTTVRGYDRDEVDLIDLLSVAGATTRVLVLNQEARFPILGDLRGVAFVDYGQLRVSLREATGSSLRLGAGAGLRYSTPVGVLRVDVGFPLRGDDRKTRYYFGLGQAF